MGCCSATDTDAWPRPRRWCDDVDSPSHHFPECMSAASSSAPCAGSRTVLLLEGKVEIRNARGSAMLADNKTMARLTSRAAPPGTPEDVARGDIRKALAMTSLR